jgi:uncharacterized RDD family membrane protein YckC
MGILGLSVTDSRPVVVGAGFWIRVLARLVDTVYGYALGFVAGVFAVIVLAILQALSLAEPGWEDRLGGSGAVMFLMGLVGFVFYHTVCEGVFGASLGKLTCGLRVLSEDLSACHLKPAFIRSLAYFVDAMFLGVIGYMSMKSTPAAQRYGDHWAKTIVVPKSQVPDGAKRSGLRFLLAFALGSLAWGFPLAAGVVWSGLR